MMIRLKIEDIAFGGDGVGRTADGMTVFVPFTAVGDLVSATIVSRKRTYARAVPDRILDPAPARIEPVCQVFTRCGGCCYQHLDYSCQQTVKERQLQTSLARIGGLTGLPPPVAPITGQAFNYRNKITLHPDPDNTAYGFKATDGYTLVPILHCPLAGTEINEALPLILTAAPVRRNLAAAAPSALVIRKAGASPVAWNLRGSGRGPLLREVLGQISLTLPFNVFWQVNQHVADELTERVKTWFDPDRTPALLDVYAGIGRYSLALGPAVEQGWLLERGPFFPEVARSAHRQARCPRRRFIPGPVEQTLPPLLREQRRRLARVFAVINPPRQGCGQPALTALCRYPPAKIAYLSCNPTTLARDLNRLVNHGPYRIREFFLADMFPQTAHFEIAVLLEPTDGSNPDG